jgi:hypothetical protein
MKWKTAKEANLLTQEQIQLFRNNDEVRLLTWIEKACERIELSIQNGCFDLYMEFPYVSQYTTKEVLNFIRKNIPSDYKVDIYQENSVVNATPMILISWKMDS